MKIKMIHEISGLVDGTPWPRRGGIVDIDETEARRLVEIGAATGDLSEPKAESVVESTAADESGVETAAMSTEPKKRAQRRA